VLSLEHATYRHAGARADSLRDITLELADGTLTGLFGPSGAGLSTLCLVLGGLAPRVVGGTLQGTLRVDGDGVSGRPMPRLTEHVVVGFGQPAAQLSLVAETVYEEVAFGPANLGVPRADVLARTWSALDALSIADLATRDPRQISGGEQQLVVLAGLLAMGPRHLVLDGPLVHLDPIHREHVLDVLEAEAVAGRAVLVADHRRATFATAVPGDGRDRWRARWTMGAGRVVDGGDVATADPAPPFDPEPEAGLPVAAPDLELQGVSHRHASGVLALDAIDLVIRGGEAVAIVGANGSGKTTLVQHLDGLLRPTHGRVLVGGADVATRSVAQLARTVALGFQDPDRQVFARSVGAEVAFGPRQLGRAPAEQARATSAALRAVGLEPLASAHPTDIGTSQRKLLAIASLLAMESPVLVLDEPTVGLDDAGVLVVERVLARQRAMGRTIVVISHDQDLVARSFERVVRLEHGRVVADGSPEDVLAG